jgi:methyl-accepting chemotaxis protein
MINKESHSIIKIFFFLTISFGIIMGLIFPLFSSFFVEYKNVSYVLLFHIICVVAGIFVGLTSFLIARFTIIKVIHNLYHEMSNLVTDEENTVKKD